MSGTLMMNRLARSSSISDGIFDFSGNLMLDDFIAVAVATGSLPVAVVAIGSSEEEQELP